MSTKFSSSAYKAIITKCLPPTICRGRRVKASDMDGNTVTIGWDYSLAPLENHQKAAAALCAQMGWSGRMISGAARGGYVHVWTEESL